MVNAASPPAAGTLVCSLPTSGNGTFSPTLTLSGSSATVSTTLNATGPCVGHGTTHNAAGHLVPLTITGVSMNGSGTIKRIGSGSANRCSAFQAHDTLGTIKVTYNWTSVPAIAPTVVTFTGGSVSIVSPTAQGSGGERINLNPTFVPETKRGGSRPQQSFQG